MFMKHFNTDYFKDISHGRGALEYVNYTKIMKILMFLIYPNRITRNNYLNTLRSSENIVRYDEVAKKIQ